MIPLNKNDLAQDLTNSFLQLIRDFIKKNGPEPNSCHAIMTAVENILCYSTLSTNASKKLLFQNIEKLLDAYSKKFKKEIIE